MKNGRIKQSIVYWCFEKYWDMDQAAKVAKQLGCESIELIAPKFFPMLKQHGLTCAIGTDRHEPRPAVRQGLQQPQVPRAGAQGHPRRDRRLRRVRVQERDLASPACARASPTTSGADNCVEGFKQIVGHAEKKGVTLCLEMLNSRVSTHPMKGHPGYQGDHTDYCIDIIKRVGSPNLKLLFDIYHVQIMDGDVISRIRQHKRLHRPRPHRGQPRPRRARRQAGDQLPADHGGAARDRLQGPRRPGVHPDPRPAGRAAGRRWRCVMCSVHARRESASRLRSRSTGLETSVGSLRFLHASRSALASFPPASGPCGRPRRSGPCPSGGRGTSSG